jgi:hypothetical protein
VTQLNSLIKQQLNSLIKQLEVALEDAYVAQANFEPIEFDVWEIGGELVERGIGAVYVAQPNGRFGWLDLENMEF